MHMPDPDEIRKKNLEAMRSALAILSKLPVKRLQMIRDSMNYWSWDPALGDLPNNWDNLPDYRRSYEPENIIGKADYLEKYAILLYILGVKSGG